MQSALRQAGHFDEVIEAIEKMVETLKEEADEDLKTKEECEKTRAEKSREAVLMSRDVDEKTDGITKLLAEIKALVAEIEEKKEAKVALEKELEEATKIRDEEHEEWKDADKMDKAAVKLIKKAQGVLKDMYKEISLGLVQKGRVVPVEAGKAPPPPPPTWDQPYGGKQDEGEGIVMILSMLADDIQKDIDKAEKEESEAKEEYTTFKKETEASVAELESAITDLELAESKKEESLEEEKSGRLDLKKSLDGVLKSYKDIGPDCDYFQTHFKIRRENRNIEIKGLMEAKGILLGSEFR
jgi:vacuolar-type H+-ATPase subunit I/STV1